MPRLNITKREADVALSVLDTVSAYTAEEVADHFGWDEEDISVWVRVTGKLRQIAEPSA